MAEVDFSPLMVNPLAQQKQAYSYADMIGQNAAKYQAGQQYAAGDYAGASRTQAQAGNIDQAQAIDQQGQKSAEAVHAYITQALPVFQKILQVHAGDPDGGKQAIAQAFDSVAPEISQLTGHNDQAIAQLRQNLVSDPQGTLSRIQAMLPVKYSNVAPGGTMLRQQGNEAPVPVYTAAPKPPDGFTGDPQNGLHYIPGGPADPALRKQYAEDKRTVIVNNPVAQPGGDISLDPQSLDYVAEQYAATGQLPPLGMGSKGVAMRQQIIQRAAQLAHDAGTTGNDAVATHADTKAMTQALGQVTKTRNMIESFEQTAQKNADLALSLLDKGGAQGQAPVVNRWIQYGRKNVGGDPDVASFDLALTTFKNEYARVVNSATGGGVTTDSARSEIEDKINTAQTPAQVRAVLATAKRDMENRRTSLIEQEQNLRSGLRSGHGNEPSTPITGAPKIRVYNPATGKLE